MGAGRVRGSCALVRPGWTDQTVAGRPALFEVKPGQVHRSDAASRSGTSTRQLVLDLEQGALRLTVMDGQGDGLAGRTMAQLGELAVAKDGDSWCAPPPAMTTLVGLLPETIGGWRALVRTSPSTRRGASARSVLRQGAPDALKAQGKTVADVTMLSATASTPRT